LVAQHFGEIVKAECLSWGKNYISLKIGLLQCSVHDIHFPLRNIIFLENDGVADTLHAVLDKILVVVSVLIEVEILGAHLGDDIFDVKHFPELFRFFKLEDRFLKVIVTWKSRGNNLGILGFFICLFEELELLDERV
jgi:hypothetical protein